jgi:hypothetical protein
VLAAKQPVTASEIIGLAGEHEQNLWIERTWEQSIESKSVADITAIPREATYLYGSG